MRRCQGWLIFDIASDIPRQFKSEAILFCLHNQSFSSVWVPCFLHNIIRIFQEGSNSFVSIQRFSPISFLVSERVFWLWRRQASSKISLSFFETEIEPIWLEAFCQTMFSSTCLSLPSPFPLLYKWAPGKPPKLQTEFQCNAKVLQNPFCTQFKVC